MPDLTDAHRKTLLTTARQSIAGVLAGQAPDWRAEAFDDVLRRPAGAFVTLKTHEGDLRGCIGSIQAVQPLFQAVASSAIAAAFRDPRFPPLHAGELEVLTLEISVMGPIEVVSDIEDIVVGRDGLIISKGRNSGLLLQQVASEYGWDRRAFLEHTCGKAGLSRDAWRADDCRIEKFSAVVFGE